jgi:flagellar biosynthetic protein FliP
MTARAHRSGGSRLRRPLLAAMIGLAALIAVGLSSVALAPGAGAAPVPAPTSSTPFGGTGSTSSNAGTGASPAAPSVSAPAAPTAPSLQPVVNGGTVSVNVDPKPSTSISILLLLTVMSVAPSLILLMTSFTKIFVVLSLTRNALGLTTVPPNQVLAGLSLFLSMFIMAPTLKAVNTLEIQPYLKGTKTQSVAFNDGIAPLRQFMLHHTRGEEIALMLRAGHLQNPPTPEKLDLTTLIPAFVLSELRSAMIIGFVIYIPFLIIDMVVSSSLMSLGMMMLPPVSVSLPFKLLLFVLVDGWGLIITSLVHSYQT